jgi:hypothetical protein
MESVSAVEAVTAPERAAAADDTNPRSVGRNLPEQLQPFGAQTVFKLSETCGVAAGLPTHIAPDRPTRFLQPLRHR